MSAPGLRQYKSEPDIRKYQQKLESSPAIAKAKPQIFAACKPASQARLFSNQRFRNAAHKAEIQTQFQGKIHRNYPVVDFVDVILDFLPHEIPNHEDIVFELPSHLCRKYSHSASKTRGEDGSTACLLKIFDCIMTQIGCKEGWAKMGKFRDMRDPVKQSGCQGYAPAFALTRDVTQDLESWEPIGLFGEVKKVECDPSECRRNEDLVIDLSPFEEFFREEYETATANAKRRRKIEQEAPRKRRKVIKREADDDGLSREWEEDMAQWRKAGQRRREESPLNDEDLAMAGYANEMMSTGVRSYATGILVQEHTMTLWYVDRIGVITSERFDFFKKPHLLVLVLSAITYADRTALGVNPLLQYPENNRDMHVPERGAELKLHSALDINNKRVERVQFAVLLQNGKIHTASDALGRGTNVIPLRIQSVNGRQVHSDRKQVAKLTWPGAGDNPEEYFVRAIRSKLREKKADALKHIVNLRYSVMRTVREVCLPRPFLSDIGRIEGDERVLRVLILDECLPLEAVDSVQEFKSVFLGALRGHHWAWEVGGVLHRDISSNNIMFYRDGNNRAVGVLCDWDLARLREDIEAEQASNTQVVFRTRTGTLPFVAIDLLDESYIPVHTYEHDLESFLFLLSYFCAAFKPKEHELGFVDPWEIEELLALRKNKVLFLQTKEHYDMILSTAHPQYAVLASDWVANSQPLFMEMMSKTLRGSCVDEVNSGRCSNYRREILEEMIAEADQLIEGLERFNGSWELPLYERFMSCLGVDPSCVDRL